MTTTAQPNVLKDELWFRLVEKRSLGGVPYCELRGSGCTYTATDLHEIINRASVPVKHQPFIPEEYRSLLCNHCNILHGESRRARQELLERNIERYGITRMLAVYLAFVKRCGKRFPVIESILMEHY